MDSNGLSTHLNVETLHGSLTDPAISSMNLLNELIDEYPVAISMAAGRPYEEFFDLRLIHEYLDAYCDHLRRDRKMAESVVTRTLFQYGTTKGVIADLIARNLAEDENIDAAPESVVVTVGAQEAMFLVLRTLRAGGRDVLLAPAPTYVGLTGAALLTDTPVWPVRSTENGIDPEDLVLQLKRADEQGKRARACYVTPNFANPTGTSMDLPSRHRLLDVAESHGILLLEDNAYGLFGAERLPSLKSLDRSGSVVYLGSFAKTGMPGARVGFAVADQRMADGGLYADQLSKLKGMLTVNTSPIAQAVIAGKLLLNDFSLTKANAREIAIYQRNLQLTLSALDRELGSCADVSWNSPTGGFFVTVTVPFVVDDELLEIAARDHGVLFTPMHHFYGGKGGFHQLRLSISLLTPELIKEGVVRLAALIKPRLP
ncbi:GntR family transcriptional regulator [Amycolatopsis sp. WAC 01375]|uniref:aminotransferase-like domain-containing protein n=1 Tax=unclassified Amycolatopsis TaxID=2618356 RepID=UPI000F76BBC6|nr:MULTISPECIES: PLP-dependent aminotransferase family protein [unclassified Amycolatopsis]QKN71278.1 PLP-dependent aminotransferase family protein [Streptomyces coelicolor]RSM78025.1 GntR family transcriptional regulator [Amycolatopsis sp. WAC 01375]RSN28351.1 GntR family transcriptional regulator [Amycolatopsis sp. WAC 01416]